MKALNIAVLTLAIVASGLAMFVTHNVEAEEPVAVFQEPKLKELDSVFHINLGSGAASLVQWMANGSQEQELARLLQGVDKVRVRIFKFDGSVSAISRKFENKFSELNGNAWPKVVSINEDNKQLLIFANSSEEAIKGLCVFIVENQEAILVSVLGEIPPAAISQFMESKKV